MFKLSIYISAVEVVEILRCVFEIRISLRTLDYYLVRFLFDWKLCFCGKRIVTEWNSINTIFCLFVNFSVTFGYQICAQDLILMPKWNCLCCGKFFCCFKLLCKKKLLLFLLVLVLFFFLLVTYFMRFNYTDSSAI